MQTVAVGKVVEGITGVGQRIMHRIGQTGAPVYNVSNACVTGATAVRTAHLSLRAGEADLALAIGCEQLGERGLLSVGREPRGTEFSPRGRDGSGLHPRRVRRPLRQRSPREPGGLMTLAPDAPRRAD